MTESPLTSPSLKTRINQDALESLRLKLSTLNVSAGRQSEPSMHEKFLEFIIDISQCPDPSTYFSELYIVSLFEESEEQYNPSNENLQSIKTILMHVLQEDVLDSEDLECLWRVMQENTDMYSTVIEILSRSTNNKIKEIFIQNIRNTPENEMENSGYEMISCVFEICKESDQLFSKQFDSFWQTLSSSPKFDLAFDAFSKGITSLIKEQILTPDDKRYLLEIFAENVGKEKLTFTCMKLIRTVLQSCPKTDDNNSLSQKSLVRSLCKEKQLLNKVIREVKSLIVKDNALKDKEFSQTIEMNQFLTFLISPIAGCSDIITFNIIISLWEITLIAENFKSLQGQLFLLIKQIIGSRIDVHLDVKELVMFLQEKTHLSKAWNISKFTTEAFDCFRLIFVVVNQHIHNISEVRLLTSRETNFLPIFERLMVKKNEGYLEEEGDFLFQADVLPNKLEGYTILWKLAWSAEDQSVASKAKDLLIYLYANLNVALHSQVKEIREEFLSLCFRHLAEMLSYEQTSEHKIIRCLEFLHSFIDQTSKENPKRSTLHSELSQGEFLTINLKHNEFYYYSTDSVIKVTSNTLVSDLLRKSKEELEINSLSLYLEEPNSKLIISDHQNTRTLGDLGITNNATLFVKSRDLPKAFLILSGKTLNPQAKLIFTKWFENFSDNQKMSPQQCAEFVHSCTNDNCRPNDRRIIEVFFEYDDDKDSYLTLDDFLNFYRDACKKKPSAVWNNLLAHKEALDLKPPKKKVEMSTDLNVTSLISSNKEYVRVLFSLLESKDEIAVKSLQLLNRLPTDPQTFADIVTLKGVRDILDLDSIKPDWSSVLDTNNIYKLFYCLNIVEYLMDSKRLDENEDEDVTEDVKRLWSQDSRLLEYKKSWLSDFVAYGGAEHLTEVVSKLSLLKTSPTLETYMTRIKYLIEAIDNVHILNMITTLIE